MQHPCNSRATGHSARLPFSWCITAAPDLNGSVCCASDEETFFPSLILAKLSRQAVRTSLVDDTELRIAQPCLYTTCILRTRCLFLDLSPVPPVWLARTTSAGFAYTTAVCQTTAWPYCGTTVKMITAAIVFLALLLRPHACESIADGRGSHFCSTSWTRGWVSQSANLILRCGNWPKALPPRRRLTYS